MDVTWAGALAVVSPKTVIPNSSPRLCRGSVETGAFCVRLMWTSATRWHATHNDTPGSDRLETLTMYDYMTAAGAITAQRIATRHGQGAAGFLHGES